MAATPTTRWQVNGYRFLVRRMEHALVRRDVRMLHDPMRSQSRALIVGIVLASLGLAGCGVLALFRPQDKIADAAIVVGKDSGAMFVAMEGTFHPVLNLASARLIIGSPDKPSIVKESEIDGKPRGALVGIPGGPSALPETADPTNAPWAVCDTVGADGNRSVASTVLVGEPKLREVASYLPSDHALLVRSGADHFLVYDGKRAAVDIGDPAITRALGLEGIEPRPISVGMLNAIPEVPRLQAPAIRGLGTVPQYPLADKTVGSVVQVSTGPEMMYYVVLEDGIQKVSSAVAQLIYFSDSQGDSGMATVTPDAINRIPSVNELATAALPAVAPTVVNEDVAPVSCLVWKPDPISVAAQRSSASVSVVVGSDLPIAADARVVALAQADGSGDRLDFAYVAPGKGGFVQATGIETESTRRDSVFYVADTGVKYGVPNEDSAKALGLSRPPDRAPWQMLELLASGPSLDKSNALVAHDGMTPDPFPAAPVN
ncbi:type VII secretion protein EccB [Rhodococcus globerulus]|uniref:type VII secretion protein EccB n=1 Tax=Rhodococcus globerulus TaxID=33008 RepID=UPI001F2C87E3|nr:type VII secretion protein EccB [Rhodococcus globerulus]MCE4263222.1 type VII secretion protein EccB [Rhodococcus globerulus]